MDGNFGGRGGPRGAVFTGAGFAANSGPAGFTAAEDTNDAEGVRSVCKTWSKFDATGSDCATEFLPILPSGAALPNEFVAQIITAITINILVLYK